MLSARCCATATQTPVSTSPENLPRRRASPQPPIEQNIEPPGGLEWLDEVVTEKVQLNRDRYRYRAQVGRDRLVAALLCVVLVAGAGAVFTNRLQAETFLSRASAPWSGYFVRGHTKE